MPLWVVAALVTAVAWLLSCFLAYDVSSLSYFAPMEKASDFRFSDFYERVARRSTVAELDDRVVIVAVDGCNRREIGRAILDVNFCAPAAIGLDIMFGAPRPGADDSLLVRALCSTPGLCLPVLVDEERGGFKERSFYDSIVGESGRYCAINIEGRKRMRTTVRGFRTHFAGVPGMAASLAGMADAPERTLPVSYVSRRFRKIEADSVLDCMDEIEGRIVLIGKMCDRGDQHITPVDNFMPGVLIHAYSVATLLHDDAPRQVPVAAQWAVGLLLCYVVVYVNLRYDGYRSNLAVRLLQFAILLILIFAGTKAYVTNGLDLNCGFAVIMVMSGLVSCDVVCGVLEPNSLYRGAWSAARITWLFLKDILRRNYDEKKSGSDIGGCDDVAGG